MAVQQFESTEDISKHYEAQIKAAGDDELAVANLRAERAERVSEFTQRQSQATERRLWVSEAVSKHGIPSELASMLDRPDWTQEQIDQQAERLAAIAKAPAVTNPTGQDLYGGGGVGGGGTPIQQSKDKDGEFLSKVEEAWNNREALSPREMQRYVEIRLGRHAVESMKRGAGKKHIWDKVPALEVDRF